MSHTFRTRAAMVIPITGFMNPPSYQIDAARSRVHGGMTEARMTRSDFAKRAATFFVMIVAGFFLGTYLDQYFAALDVEDGVTWSTGPRASAASVAGGSSIVRSLAPLEDGD
jgi:hypothetical protein